MFASERKKWNRAKNRRRGERVRATRMSLALKAKRRGLSGRYADWTEFAAAVKEQEAAFQESGA